MITLITDFGDRGGYAGIMKRAILTVNPRCPIIDNTDEFSGAVLVAKEGKPIFQKAYGLSSQSYNIPNRIDTKFNLGSINKMFTKIAIAQLAEREQLSFDDTIQKHLPDYPNRRAAEQVTIQHLLSMTSGIGDFFNEKYEATPKNRLRTINDYLPLFASDTLEFEPGSRRRYSNGGYIVIGAIIEKASGESYYDYVREHVFKPAGMEHALPNPCHTPCRPT